MSPTDAYRFALLVLCIWREARGESLSAKMGVAWSIRNRVQKPSWWGNSWDTVILCDKQYSSFNADDPNATKIPKMTDPSYPDCSLAAVSAYNGLGADPTQGATNYYSGEVAPSWAAEMSFTITIGAFRFYK
jgi:N-acetylmuramoyl-L-alanine amidase